MATPIYLDGDLNMQFDWPPLDLENTLETPPESAQESQGDAARQAESVSQSPRSNCVRQLTVLAADIDQVSQDLSAISHIHMPKNRSVDDYHAEFIQKFASHRCVEQLFTLAQRLTDIYPQALKILFSRLGYSQCQDPNCFHTIEMPDALEDFFSTTDEDQDGIDSFLFNLLVLCHTKVIDVMGFLIITARTCTQITFASPDRREPEVHIPEVRVGNFVATHSAASSMQIVLLIHIASVLRDYAGQLSTQVATTVGNEKRSKQNHILKLQCELLEERAISKMKSLEQVKAVLMRLGFIN